MKRLALVLAALAALGAGWACARRVSGSEGHWQAPGAQAHRPAVGRFGYPTVDTMMTCHCLCHLQHPDKPGICKGDAILLRIFQLEGEPVDVPFCQPCSDVLPKRQVPIVEEA